jgi:hypothetical protein
MSERPNACLSAAAASSSLHVWPDVCALRLLAPSVAVLPQVMRQRLHTHQNRLRLQRWLDRSQRAKRNIDAAGISSLIDSHAALRSGSRC